MSGLGIVARYLNQQTARLFNTFQLGSGPIICQVQYLLDGGYSLPVPILFIDTESICSRFVGNTNADRVHACLNCPLQFAVVSVSYIEAGARFHSKLGNSNFVDAWIWFLKTNGT